MAAAETTASTTLGRAPANDELIRLDAMPTAEQFQEIWRALAEIEEFGTEVVHSAAMDAAHAAHVTDEVAFDRSSLTWESVGRLALYVDDTRSSLATILKHVAQIAETLPYLYEALHREGDLEDWQPPYNRYGGQYGVGWPVQAETV